MDVTGLPEAAVAADLPVRTDLAARPDPSRRATTERVPEDRPAALPASLIAVLETDGRRDLDSVFDSLLHELDQALPERRWSDEPDWVDEWDRSAAGRPGEAFERFWETEDVAEAGRATRDLVVISVLIPLVALAALGALVLSLGG